MFQDRKEAGKLLAEKLSKYKNKKDVLVLAIPKGGVPVAYEIAKKLKAPFDIVVIKKIGMPGNEELALGAASIDDFYLNEELAEQVSKQYLEEEVEVKQQEARKKLNLMRGKKKMYSVKDKVIILVDDGVATGATMIMGIKIIKKQSPEKVIVAIPVAPPITVLKLEKEADEVICLLQPEFFMSIGQFYNDFTQVEDEIAKKMLIGAEKWQK
ncbi:MAG: phosphoribosyltransferase family protein [Nanoarchaeota archaeon]